MKQINTGLTYLFLLSLCYACQNEDQVHSHQLLGRWALVSALRNGQPTDALEGIYFDFRKPHQMETNFTQDNLPKSGPYTVQEDTLTLTSGDTFFYRIESISENNLQLRADWRGFDFQLMLKKVKN